MALSPAAAQVAILQIQVVEGEGAVHLAGSRQARPLTVEITDETGKPVEGAAVSFHLPENGPGGTFANGLRTEVVLTDSRGRAGLRTLQLNRTPGRFEIRIVASKEQARAGTVSFQYIAEPKSGAAAVSGRRHRKWVALAALAAGGAVAGILVAGRSGGPAPAVPPAGTPVPTLTIGLPAITVGKP